MGNKFLQLTKTSPMYKIYHISHVQIDNVIQQKSDYCSNIQKKYVDYNVLEFLFINLKTALIYNIWKIVISP